MGAEVELVSSVSFSLSRMPYNAPSCSTYLLLSVFLYTRPPIFLRLPPQPFNVLAKYGLGQNRPCVHTNTFTDQQLRKDCAALRGYGRKPPRVHTPPRLRRERRRTRLDFVAGSPRECESDVFVRALLSYAEGLNHWRCRSDLLILATFD